MVYKYMYVWSNIFVISDITEKKDPLFEVHSHEAIQTHKDAFQLTRNHIPTGTGLQLIYYLT